MKLWVVVFFLATQFLGARMVKAEEVAAMPASSAVASSAAPALTTADAAAPPAGAPPASTIVAASSDAVDAKPANPAEECKENLAQLENEYQQVVMDIRNLNQNVNSSRDEYMKGFQQVTQALVDFSLKKEDELKKIMESRQALQVAMQNYAEQGSDENSKALQDSYMNLTVRMYAQAMEGQNTIDALKGQMNSIESVRSQYEVSQKSQADLDEKKLDLEGKMASLKIRCQKN
jgi:hypothetical protein